MHDTGIFYVPTITVIDYVSSLPGRKDHDIRLKELGLSKDTFKRALKAHVKVAFGTEAFATSIDNTDWHTFNPATQFAVMTDLGMAPMQAIRSAT